jgi:mono/diheme cytochrome c family protein
MRLFRRTRMLGCVAVAVLWLAPASAEDLSHYSGEELYQRLCAACHGEHGEGDGTVASYFKMQPPDLTQLAKRRGGQYPADAVRRIVDGRDVPGPHGSRQMPVWGVALYYADPTNPDQEKQVKELVDRVVEYLGTIQKE